MDCSLPGSSVHGIFQARILEWVAISFSRGSSQLRDRTRVSCIAGKRFTIWATREDSLTLGSFKFCFLEQQINQMFQVNPQGSGNNLGHELETIRNSSKSFFGLSLVEWYIVNLLKRRQIYSLSWIVWYQPFSITQSKHFLKMNKHQTFLSRMVSLCSLQGDEADGREWKRIQLSFGEM